MLPVVKPIIFPAALEGEDNGKLSSSLLVSTPGQAGGATVYLVEPAARGWRAMCARAKEAGHILKVTSPADSYRTYERQVATFVARYEPDPFPGYIGERWWPGHYDSQGRWVAGHMWYQKPNTAVAAVPGTSNHGWGLACDIGEESDGDSGVESLDTATLNWLIANAYLFGVSAEVQSEPWHWRRYSGDVIEPAILAYEQEQSMASDLDAFVPPYGSVRENGYMAHHLLLAIIRGEEPYHGYWDGVDTPPPNDLWALLGRVEAKLDQLLARPPVQSAPVDVEALAAALVAALTESGLPVSVASVAEIATATVDQHKLRL